MKLTRENIRGVLSFAAPLTTREIASFFPDFTHEDVASAVISMRKAAVKQVYIQSWTRDNGYGKTYLRAQYAIGDLPDARKPRIFSNKEVLQRRRDRLKSLRPGELAANSVFAWAQQLDVGEINERQLDHV